ERTGELIGWRWVSAIHGRGDRAAHVSKTARRAAPGRGAFPDWNDAPTCMCPLSGTTFARWAENSRLLPCSLMGWWRFRSFEAYLKPPFFTANADSTRPAASLIR